MASGQGSHWFIESPKFFHLCVVRPPDLNNYEGGGFYGNIYLLYGYPTFLELLHVRLCSCL